MPDDLPFGLELVLSAHSKYLERKADALTCFIHWKLLTEGELRCVGTGEIFSVSNASNEHPSSEILREEAFFKASNGEEEAESGIAIKYRGLGEKKTCKYLLKLHEMDTETLLVNLIRISDEKVITLKFNPDKIICDSFKNTSDISNIFVDIKDLNAKIEKEVMEVLFPKPSSPTSSAPKVDRGTGIQEPRPIPLHPGPLHPQMPRRPFPDIIDPTGRGDLEPFSNDGSGMIMDPFGGRRGRDPNFPNFDPPFPGMRGQGFF